MSKSEFIELCGFYSIDPQIALESEELCEALRSRDAVEARRILKEDFLVVDLSCPLVYSGHC